MVRNIFLAFIVVASVTTPIYAAVVPLEGSRIESTRPNNFTFIGSCKNLAGKAKGTGFTYQESLYFLSQNAAGQEVSNTDCVNILGPDGSLLNIETQEELKNVTEFLRGSGDSGTVYWTSGRFNVIDKVFEWGNGVPLSPFVPWSPNHPTSRLPITRIALSVLGGTPQLMTQFNTVSSRAICELRVGEVGEEAEPCYTDNDLVIVLDSSGSIGQVNYLSALTFAANLATTWVDNPNNRISVVIYSSTVTTVIGLGESVTGQQIQDKVYNAPYLGGGTASDLGINMAVTEFQNHARAVPKNMVFLTDGASDSPSATLSAAQSSLTAGIRSFAIGITSSINQEELLAIAGNDASHVFNTEGFNDLLKLLQPLSQGVCS